MLIKISLQIKNYAIAIIYDKDPDQDHQYIVGLKHTVVFKGKQKSQITPKLKI